MASREEIDQRMYERDLAEAAGLDPDVAGPILFTDAEWAEMLADPVRFGLALACGCPTGGVCPYEYGGDCLREPYDPDEELPEHVIRCANCGGAHRSVAEVRTCHARPVRHFVAKYPKASEAAEFAANAARVIGGAVNVTRSGRTVEFDAPTVDAHGTNVLGDIALSVGCYGGAGTTLNGARVPREF